MNQSPGHDDPTLAKPWQPLKVQPNLEEKHSQLSQFFASADPDKEM
jgi:hypothetical protein